MPKTSPAVLRGRGDEARSLGRRLAKAREAAGMSQLQVGRHLGVPQSKIAKLELGQRHLKFTEGLRLAQLYNIEPGQLDPEAAPTDGVVAHRVTSR